MKIKKFKPEYQVTVSWKDGKCIGYFPCNNLKEARETKRHFDSTTPHLKHEHLILKITTEVVEPKD